VGLKPPFGNAAQGRGLSSNRTIVGLKHHPTRQIQVFVISSNRTIVGLKPSNSFNSQLSTARAAIAPLWD